MVSWKVEKRNSVPDILNRIKIEDKELGNSVKATRNDNKKNLKVKGCN